MASRRETLTDVAKRIYGASWCSGRVAAYSDYDIIDCRVRAFVDGMNWQKKQTRRKAKRS